MNLLELLFCLFLSFSNLYFINLSNKWKDKYILLKKSINDDFYDDIINYRWFEDDEDN